MSGRAWGAIVRTGTRRVEVGGRIAAAGVAVLASFAWAAPLTARQTSALRGVEEIPGVRVVELRAEPESPAFAEPFLLHVTLRSRDGLLVALSDSLFPTPGAHGAGPGAWTRRDAPGDSVDLAGVYPVIGFLEGLIEYPWIGVELGGAGVSTATTAYLRLGGIELVRYAPLDERGLSSPPRPPADVLGGGWSGWRTAGALLLAAAAIGTVALTAAAVRDRRRAGRGRLVRDPRAEALRDLDRILAAGWHRNGRVADFYASTGDALRAFVGERDPALGMHLTSTELLRRLSAVGRGRGKGDPTAANGSRPGAGTPPMEALEAALGTGERVKFGGYRPDPDTAERHWRAVRDWIRDFDAAPSAGELPR